MTATFPERMQQQARDTHTRRARTALDAIAQQVENLRYRMDTFLPIDASDAQHLAEQAMRVGIHLGALEMLREAREWDDAERQGQ